MLQRRRFVEFCVAGGAAAPLAASAGAGAPDVADVLRRLVSNPQAAAWIGRACLAAGLVSSAEVTAFVVRLADAALEPAVIEARFRQSREADFAAVRLRSLDGWQMADSEMLALAALALA